MEVASTFDGSESLRCASKESLSSFDITKHELVEKLKERIAELELELQKQKKAVEKNSRLLNVIWGDDFNDESLH
jgi:hypothetical protein